MRIVQTGILICLLAIAGLLVATYRQQARLEATAERAVAAERTRALEAIQAPRLSTIEPPKPSPRPVERSRVAAPARLVQAAPVRVPEPASQAVVAAEPAPEQTKPSPASMVEPAPVAELEPSLPEPAEPVASAELEPPTAALAEPLREEPAPEPRVVTIEAGERLAVRIDNTLSTSRHRVDDTFFATLDEALIVDGLIIADKGARLQGRIVESQQAGRLKGLARLACELTHLDTDDGQRVPIRSSVFALDGPRTRGKDMKRVAIGAGAGAILGAIFGGGKGAAIGAASGAGAGAGTAAATRGEPAVIEPETRLDFRLTEGVTVTEKL